MTRRAICVLSIALACLPLAADEAEKSFDELVAGATARPGLFDTYEKGDHLYLAIPRERLGEELLLVPRIRRGIGDRGLYANTMYTRLEASVVTLERRGERVFLLELPHRFTAAPDTPAAVAVERGYSPSVLAAAKVEAERGDGAAVIDVYGWVVGDLVDAESFVKQAISEPGKSRGVSLDAGRSYLEEVKAFPRNLELSSRLTFRPSESPELDSVPDNRFLSLGLRFSFIALPAEPMTPRLADDRIGLLVNARKNYSRTGDSSFFERIADRWRLEPGEQVGDLRRPQEPIVYYLDATIPEAYRPFVKAGVEAWNAAFAAAGFHEAIRAEPLPDGADPADVRYHTVTWTASMRPFGAFGNEIADPRTGEMLDADVVVDAGFIESLHHQWRSLVAPRAAAQDAPGDGRPDHLRDGYGLRLAAEAGLGRLALAARGELAGGADPRALEFVGEYITELTMHEVGHTIGLDHNFRASSATPLDKLGDPRWTAEHGISASVMDYLPVNLAPLGEPEGERYMRAVGPYDRWAIAYLYTPDAGRAAQLARRSADPSHTFGTDVDLYAPGALDPLTHSWDLSADPLAWGRRRLELVRQLLPRLPEIVLTDGARYGDLTDAVDVLYDARFGAVRGAVRWIGGQYVHRDHVGDPGGRPPFVPVPRGRQLEALALLTQEAFAPESFALPPEVEGRLGARHWDHWGHEPTYDGRIDPPLHDRVLEGLTRLLEGLTDPYRLARIRDAEGLGGEDVLTLPELMATLTAAIWEEAWTPPAVDPTALRRDLQRAWLDRLAVLLLKPPERTPADARAVARAALVDLGERLGGALGRREGLDAVSAAHFEESAARIARVLDAQLAASLP
jgi:hypothetical protein